MDVPRPRPLRSADVLNDGDAPGVRSGRAGGTVLTPSFAELAPSAFVSAARRALRSPPAGIDPWFLSYCGDLATDAGLRAYARAKWQLVSLIGGVVGRDILDAGSGFGMDANLLAHWGARRIYAVERHQPMSAAHTRILARDFGHLRNVEPIRADVSRLPMKSECVDVVLSVEAISHYFEVDAFLDECARVLRRGGSLVISDGNNGANPRIRAATVEIWWRWEHGPHGRIGDHDIQETMTERRARLIRARFPDLTDVEIADYAANTSGFVREQIETAILAHRAGAPAPGARYRHGDLPRDPELGCVVERLFDPRTLGRDIEQRGFTVRVLPHFGGSRNNWVLLANLMLRRLPLFALARAFRIVATKR